MEVFSNLNSSVILCDELGDEGFLHSGECFALLLFLAMWRLPVSAEFQEMQFVHRDLEDEVTPSFCLTQVLCS